MIEFVIVLCLTVFLTLSPLVMHEMGHWAMLKRYKVSVDSVHLGLGMQVFQIKRIKIGLFPIGGAIEPNKSEYQALTPSQKIKIAFAGPIASLIYALCCILAYSANIEIPKIHNIMTIAYMNIILGGVNLLPIPPLDGYLIWEQYKILKNEQLSTEAQRIMARVGNGMIYGIGFFVIASVLFK